MFVIFPSPIQHQVVGNPLTRGVPCHNLNQLPPFLQIYKKNQAPQRPLPNPPCPNPYPISQRRCYKCQGLRHIASDCPSCKVVTLAEWEAIEGEFAEEKEEEKEEGVDVDLEND